ncbi:MAG: hypothetical protein WDO15_18990 [Bacteroidota bacterium]
MIIWLPIEKDWATMRSDYENIWGVADENLFTLAQREIDKTVAEGKPVFAQVMTTSNHSAVYVSRWTYRYSLAYRERRSSEVYRLCDRKIYS